MPCRSKTGPRTEKSVRGLLRAEHRTQGKGSALAGTGPPPALPGLRGDPKAAPQYTKSSLFSLLFKRSFNFLLRLGWHVVDASSGSFASACGESSLPALHLLSPTQPASLGLRGDLKAAPQYAKSSLFSL